VNARTRWEEARDWERSQDLGGYAAHFARLVAAGEDVEGEARLADALVGRRARILDAGSGMGRVGAALLARGHRVVGVDLDAELLEQSRATFPDLPVVRSRLDDLTAEVLRGAGHEAEFDLVVCVGNVMVLLAPGTERGVLARLRALMAPHARLLVGFHLREAPTSYARVYSPEEFAADAAAVGLAVESRFGSYALTPFDAEGDYAVFVLVHAAG
jgi:SAM-dependent methyltransferase